MADGGKRAFSPLVPILHVFIGALFLALGSALRLPRGGLPFLVFGAWFGAVGLGLVFGETWAWWSAVIAHPLLLVGEVVVVFVAFFATGEASKAGGLGKLGAVVLGCVFVVGLVMAFLSVRAWFWLRRPAVREVYFRSDPKLPGSPPGPATSGLAPAAAGLILVAAACAAGVVWNRPPKPPAERGAPRSVAGTATTTNPCAPRLGIFAFDGAQFSPDSRRLIARAGDGTLCVWDLATGRLEAALDAGALRKSPGTRPEGDVAISPDGALLATVGRAREGRTEIRIWETASGRQTGTLPVQATASVRLAGFGPTAASLILLVDRTVSILDTATGAVRATKSIGPTGAAVPLAVSPRRSRIAFGVSMHGPVTVLDVETGEAKAFDPLPSPSVPPGTPEALRAETVARVEGLLFSPDNKTLYLGRFKAVSVFDLVEWKEKPPLVLPMDARSWGLTPLAVTGGGARLLADGGGFMYPIFDLATGELVTQGVPRVTATKTEAPLFIEGKLWNWGPEGRVVQTDGRIAYVALMPREGMVSGLQASQSSSQSNASAVSPDGSLLVLNLEALSNLTLWEAGTGKWNDMLSRPGTYANSIRHIAFSPDRRTLAVTARGIDVWNIPKRKLLYRLGDE